MFAHGEPVTRLRAPLVEDRYSGPDATTRDWTTATSVVIDGWGISQDSTSEPLEVGRESTTSDFTLYRQDPADVTAKDRLIIRGLECEVVGNPFTWRSPLTGWQSGQVVKANIREG